jgi:hypothetical protein
LDGSPDLTNVATDGSHVIFLNDTTAGARNFGKITAKDNTAKTVTVANAFGLSLSGKGWAIGGKRASLLGTLSGKLLENNSASGDAMPGWAMEMASGHSETRSSTVTLRRSGNTTDGAIIVRGAASPATLPLLTFSNNGAAFSWSSCSGWTFQDLELRNSNATKTASTAFSGLTFGGNLFRRVRIDHSTDRFGLYAFSMTSATAGLPQIIDRCKLGYMTSALAASVSFQSLAFRMLGCDIRNTTGSAISITVSNGSLYEAVVVGNVIWNSGGRGIYDASSAPTAASWHIEDNTINGSTNSGIEINAGTATELVCRNNQLTNNGAYGFLTAISTAVQLFRGWVVDRNNTYNNTSGAYSGLDSSLGTNDPGTNPSYTDATNGNFTPTASGVKGVSEVVGKYGGSTTYRDIGAVQHQDAGSGATGGSYTFCS